MNVIEEFCTDILIIDKGNTILKQAIEQAKDTECNIITLTDIHRMEVDFINIQREYVYEETDIEISVHNDNIGKNHLLYIANHSSQIKTARLYYHGKRNFHGIWRGNGRNKNNSFEVEITPYTVSVWRVEREEESND
jgi:ABC-type uncharacterized transport system ATPase subunit